MPDGPDDFSHMSGDELRQAISNMEGDIAVENENDEQINKPGSTGSIAHLQRMGLSRDVGPIYDRLDKAKKELRAREATGFDPSRTPDTELDREIIDDASAPASELSRETIDDAGRPTAAFKGPLLALGAGLLGAAAVLGLALSHIGPFSRTSIGSPATGSGSSGVAVASESAPATPAVNKLTVGGAKPFSGTVTYSDVKCYVPGYGGHEIDALLTVGGRQVGIAALDSGTPLGLSPTDTYVSIHLDLSAGPSDPSGWLSAAKIATFKGATFKTVDIDGPLFMGTTPGPESVPDGKAENLHISCAQ